MVISLKLLCIFKKKSQQTITDDYYPARASCFFVTNPKYFRDIIYSIQMALV